MSFWLVTALGVHRVLSDYYSPAGTTQLRAFRNTQSSGQTAYPVGWSFRPIEGVAGKIRDVTRDAPQQKLKYDDHG